MRRFNDITISLEQSPIIFMGKNNSGKSTILSGISQILERGLLDEPILNKSVEQSNNVIRELYLELTQREWENLLRISKYPIENNPKLQKIIPDLPSLIVVVRFVNTYVEGKFTQSTWEHEIIGIESLPNPKDDYQEILKQAVSKLRDNTLKEFASTVFISSERNFKRNEKYLAYPNLIGNEERNQFIRTTLYHLKDQKLDEFNQLIEQIKKIFPEIDDIDIKLNNQTGNFDLKVIENGREADINEMGSGTKSLILILSLILFPNTKIAILDEPDINMHDELVRKFAKFIEFISSKTQIIIASHHPTFINEFKNRNILHVKMKNESNVVTSIVEQNPVSEILEDLGVPQGNFEKAETSESKLVVLTEGPTDKGMIEAFAAKLQKSDELARVSPIFHPRGGKKYLDYEILDKINGSPTPFLLIYDRDELNDPQIQAVKEKLKDRIHILSKREIENYCLDYETLFEFIKEFEDKKTEQINDKIKKLTINELKQKIFGISQELKRKTILMSFIHDIPKLQLLDRIEFHNFIEKNQNQEIEKIVDELYQNFIQKIGSISITELRETLKKAEQNISSKWTESEILKICPGKDLTRLINKWLNDEFRISFSSTQMIKKLKTIDDDISTLISKIVSLGNSNRNV